METTFEQKKEDARLLIQIGQAMAQARQDFGLTGINTDPKADIETAKSLMEGIRRLRKFAKVEDVIESIRLFGKGIIRFEGQLNVVSVHNVIRTYEFYLKDYLPRQNDRTIAKIEYIPASHQLQSGDEIKNKSARRELFVAFLENPNGHLSAWYERCYDVMEGMELITLSTKEKIEAYQKLATHIFENKTYPQEIFSDKYKRQDMWLFRSLLEEFGWPAYSTLANNAFHHYLIKRCKLDLIEEQLKLGKDKLIAMYDSHNETNL